MPRQNIYGDAAPAATPMLSSSLIFSLSASSIRH